MIAWLKSKKTLSDVLVGVAGAAGAQIISFILVPVVARLFSPEDFGAASTVLAVFAVLVVIGSLRYEEAVMLPRAEEDAKVLSCVALRILLVICLISVLGLSVATLLPLYPFREHDFVLWVVLLPAILLTSGAANILMSWNNRLRKFHNIALSNIAAALGTSIPRIGLGYTVGSSVLGLLLGSLIGYVASLLVLWGGTKHKLSALCRSCRMQRGVAARLMAEYKDFPIYSAPTGFVRELKENIPLLGLTWLFSAQVVGFYAMAHRLTRLPVAVMSMPIRRVFIQRALQARHDGGDIREMLLKSTAALLFMGLPPLLLLVGYGSELFTWLLGARWEGAGRYAEILAVWLFSIFVLTPSAATFTVVRKQRVWFFFQIVGALIGFTVFLAAGLLSLSDIRVLELYAASQVVLNGIIMVVALRMSSPCSVR